MSLKKFLGILSDLLQFHPWAWRKKLLKILVRCWEPGRDCSVLCSAIFHLECIWISNGNMSQTSDKYAFPPSCVFPFSNTFEWEEEGNLYFMNMSLPPRCFSTRSDLKGSAIFHFVRVFLFKLESGSSDFITVSFSPDCAFERPKRIYCKLCPLGK